MWYKAELIFATFIICTIIVVLLLKFAYVPFTPTWLLPIAGGMLIGIGAASLRKLSNRADRSHLGREYVEPVIQLVLGIAFLVTGYFTL